jgi:hypothetical protein
LRDKKFRLFLILLYIGTIILYLFFVQRGIDYYLTPLQERPRHVDYAILKPGGDIGHGLGIIGSSMMMIMLLYSVRKRKTIFNNLGSISHWLDVHIYFGIFGPLFIILHSSLKVGGLVAISFYSMLAVALSGILGRYLYMQIPRNIRGHELSLKESELLNNQLTEQLKTKYDYTDEMINSIEKHTAVERLKSKSVTVFFLTLFWQDVQRFFQFRRMKKQFSQEHHLSTKELKMLMSITRQKTTLVRRLFVLDRVHHLFHYWHVIHKPFAIIMIVIMFVHIGVAVAFGYTWIF